MNLISCRYRRRRNALTCVALLAIATAACLDRVIAPAVDDVAGRYQAKGPLGTVTTEVDDQATHWLDSGASVDLILYEDGTTEGDMYLPPAGDDPSTAYDLAGSWSLDGDAVRLHHDAPTWLREIVFRFMDDSLTGAVWLEIDGVRTRVRVTLPQI